VKLASKISEASGERLRKEFCYEFQEELLGAWNILSKYACNMTAIPLKPKDLMRKEERKEGRGENPYEVRRLCLPWGKTPTYSSEGSLPNARRMKTALPKKKR